MKACARLLDQLAETGLVERRADPTDRRAYQLFLTPAAAPHLSVIAQIAAEIQAEMLHGLNKQQSALVLSSLRIVRNNLAAR
jgi:DNA-binding MarR family transcriptional regulator